MSFDSHSYLNEMGINYWTEGKNVSSGWTGVKCVWCGDRSNHLGISPDGFSLKCWACGQKKNMLQFIMAVEKCNFAAAKSIAKKYTSDYIDTTTVQEHGVSKVEIPTGVKPHLDKHHRKYLRKRNYHPRLIEDTFHLYGGGVIGPFKYRIVAPVYENNKILTLVGRDITDKSAIPYKNLSGKKSVLPAKHCVYNIDNIGDTAIIVEGITDVWRLGSYGVIATLGLVFTNAQINRIASKLKKAYIMFDSEPQAIRQAEELANLLHMQGVNTIEILELSEGDPADLTKDEVVGLRKSIFGGVLWQKKG